MAEPAPSPDLLPVVWELHHALLAMSRQMERTLGVSGPARLVLREVARQPGISLGQLAAALRVHPSTITGLVDNLTRRRLLRRNRDTADRRTMRLRASEAGLTLLARDAVTIETVVEEARITREGDAAHAAAFLSHLASALRTASKGAPPAHAANRAPACST